MARFVAALVVDDQLLLRAMRDPHAAAAEYGVELTDDQAAHIRVMQPEELGKLRKQLAFWPWEGGSFW